MTRSKIAISLPKDQLVRVHREVQAGRADSSSGYIARVLEEQAKTESLRELLRDLIEQHGQPGREDIKCAERTRTAERRMPNAGALIILDRGDKRISALIGRVLLDFTATKKQI